MNMLIRLIFLFMLFLTSQSGIATTTKLVNHQYDVNHISQGEGIYGYDTSSNHRNSHLNLTSVKVQGRSFLAFISDLLATKSVKPAISAQKQAGHIPGTPQNANRLKQGKPTSSFFGENSGNLLTRQAFEKGKPVPGRPKNPSGVRSLFLH